MEKPPKCIERNCERSRSRSFVFNSFEEGAALILSAPFRFCCDAIELKLLQTSNILLSFLFRLDDGKDDSVVSTSLEIYGQRLAGVAA
jgi:hypothetical protein